MPAIAGRKSPTMITSSGERQKSFTNPTTTAMAPSVLLARLLAAKRRNGSRTGARSTK